MIFKPLPRAIARSFNLWSNRTFFFCNDKVTVSHEGKKGLAESSKSLNSIRPSPEEGYAYGHYFPKEWTEEHIQKTLDPTLRDVQRVSIVKNKVGEHSGKVIIKFKNEKTRKQYIQKYNEDFIISDSQSQRVVILPFTLKTREESKKAREGLNFKYPVRISNLDFDITKEELLKLAVDYGEVSHIDLNERQSGINRGFATVYFQKGESAQEFTSFLDGLLYRDRKLKAQMIEKQIKKQEKEYLKVPTFTFQANIELMKRLKSKQYEQK